MEVHARPRALPDLRLSSESFLEEAVLSAVNCRRDGPSHPTDAKRRRPAR